MKLSRLYSNRPATFAPIDFADGLNVLLAEIRLPENRDKDTHNLGKSLLGRLIDFGFLSGKDPRMFLFKHPTLFEDFTFFLEVRLLDGGFVTVRRGVKEASKIAIKRHAKGGMTLSSLPDAEWDHVDVPFEKARELLDGLLDWRALKPWAYRKELGYLLRSQDDYREVFQLRKFSFAHADWKPFVAQVLGFDARPVEQFYQKEKQLADTETLLRTVREEVGGPIEDDGKIDGILLLKRQDAEKAEALLAAFDFRSRDKVESKLLVDEVDRRIAELNATRYSLSHARKKIQVSIEDDSILFDPEEAGTLFAEAGVLFHGQIKKDFEQLIAFNRAITDERRGYLLEERTDIDAQLRLIAKELNELGRRRSEMLAFLTSTDSFEKYKRMSADLVVLKSEIAALDRQRGSIHRLNELRAAIRTLTEEKNHLQTAIEANLDATNSDRSGLFSMIRIHFSEFVEGVLDRKALLSVHANQLGHLEFVAEILDEGGNSSSADRGHTHRKLLCIAFDMAVLRAHLDVRFPRFAFHDGAFESLDDRKKENLLGVLRRYADLGVQSIITVIDSDIPVKVSPEFVGFQESEIILRLHDEGNDGRLFKMHSW